MERKQELHCAEQAPRGMGWLHDHPDFRDYTDEHELIQPLLGKTRVGLAKKDTLPARVDLRAWCSPIEDQGSLGSCTANAGVGIVEYFERRAYGKHIDASRLFLYKATRNLLHWTGDTGAFLRTTMKALRLFGVPPEEYWPYVIADFDVEPSAFCYAFGEDYEAVKYYRLDPPGRTEKELLKQIKKHLAAGLPSMFGFTVYDSIGEASATGKIPVPVSGESCLGGHAVVAVGYDDDIQTQNSAPGSPTYKGALLIRNSWGTGWGPMGGYLWLPYEYVLRGLATDWWTLIRAEWVDTAAFE
ncbi:MAG: C1 family peptidase [Thermotogota bacterium]